ncbi:MAG TPA: YggS family pyridoxal phosphate-dependent enzyme [Longimicrobiales bacterium]|nr:YggS family pyridoxal phosphate-dependent enzyme [Longimicrobiales bacterium]
MRVDLCSHATYNLRAMFDERLRDGLPRVRERIAAALERSGRAGEVRLVAVTKGHPVDAARAAWRAGITDLGENRVQELAEKRVVFPAGEPGPIWHLIGHLQRNKARRALELSDWIQSVDSTRLALELSREAVRAGRPVRVLVQVNVSGEATKGGFDASQAVAEVAEVADLPNLEVAGLMTIAPYTDDEKAIRSVFAGTRALLDRCVAEGVALHGRELSMGMTHDYEAAIAEGSTMVRLGTALFGERL